MTRHLRVRLAVLFGSIVAASCGGGADSSVTPDPNSPLPPVDIQAVMTSLFAELGSPALIGPSTFGLAVTGSAITDISQCAYSVSAQRFVCPDITVSGLTLTKSFTLSDGSGAPQSRYDPFTTGTIRIESTLAGPLAPGSPFVTEGTQALELDGIRTGTHAVNGTAHAILTGIVDSASGLPVTHTFNTSISNLVVKASTAATDPHVWPPRGVISTLDSASIQGAVTSTSNFEVHFSGTSVVSVVVTQGTSTHTCSMDLTVIPLLCQ